MYPLNSLHLFAYTATLQAPPEVIGPVPEGIRSTFYITGGVLLGPRLKGKMLGTGADWALIRRDGLLELDVRGTLQTEDGALIYVRYTGLGDLGVQGYAQFLAGELPQRLRLTTTPVFRTAHPDYQWLHRAVCVGVGEADLKQFTVSYDVYALS